MFPSPYGDMVLKFEVLCIGTTHTDIVSVPLRGYGFEIGVNSYSLRLRTKAVSVPLRGYGFEIALSVYQRRSCSKSVSVPLRGYGFEILTKKRSFGGTTEIVSVPLRGYGFEISIKEAFAVAAQSFPSPYGDMVLKFRMSWYQLWWILYCFRPLTGIWFWNGR